MSTDFPFYPETVAFQHQPTRGVAPQVATDICERSGSKARVLTEGTWSWGRAWGYFGF